MPYTKFFSALSALPFTVRLDPETKQEAEDVLQALGLNAWQAIHLFLRQVALRRALPFAVALPMDEMPNSLTHQTIRVCFK